MGRGRPKNAITHSTAPSEKNQNSSPAQSRCVTVARAKAVKNVCVRIAQIGRRKIAKTNFTQRVGTSSGSDAATKLLDLAYATLRTSFRPRSDLLLPRLFFDLRFVAAKVACRLRSGIQIKARLNRGSVSPWLAHHLLASETLALLFTRVPCRRRCGC